MTSIRQANKKTAIESFFALKGYTDFAMQNSSITTKKSPK
jgi:hypothetical protein